MNATLRPPVPVPAPVCSVLLQTWWCRAFPRRTGSSTPRRSPAWLWTWWASAAASGSPTSPRVSCRYEPGSTPVRRRPAGMPERFFGAGSHRRPLLCSSGPVVAGAFFWSRFSLTASPLLLRAGGGRSVFLEPVFTDGLSSALQVRWWPESWGRRCLATVCSEIRSTPRPGWSPPVWVNQQGF